MATRAVPTSANEAAARAPVDRRTVAGLAAMVVLTLVTRLPRLGHPAADFDEQLYSLIGQQMLHGALPYIDLWDRKPPGLFALYALFHAVGGPSPLAYQIGGLIACLIGGWLTWRAGCFLTDRGTAAFGAALYPPLMALYGSHSGQSEIFLMPLLLGMAVLFGKAWHSASVRTAATLSAAAMLCGGLALQIKYSAVPSCLLGGLIALSLLRKGGIGWPALAGFSALFAGLGVLPTALAAAWLASRGAFADFVFANFVSIGLRAPMPLAVTLAKQLTYAVPLALLVLLGILAGRRTRPKPLRRAAWAWLAACTAGLFLGSTIYVYYYAVLVPAAILLTLPALAPTFRWGRLLAFALPLWLVGMQNPIAQVHKAREERQTLSDLTSAIAPLVQNRTHPLFVYDGPVVLYQLSGSALPGRIVYPDHLGNALEAAALPADPAAETARILAREPAAIVTSDQPVSLRNRKTDALLRSALARDYRLVSTPIFQNRPLQLWVRR